MCNDLLALSPRPTSTIDFSLGPIVTNHARGLRAEIGLAGAHGFAIGIATGFSTAAWQYGDTFTGAAVTYQDVSATVVVAKTFAYGAWRLRLHAGAGVLHTAYEGTSWPMLAFQANLVEGTGTTKLVEAGLALGYDITPDWSVMGGPIYLRERQRFLVQDGFGAMFEMTRSYEVGGWLAIQKHL